MLGSILLLVGVPAKAQPLVYVYGRADFPSSGGGMLATSADFDGDGRPDFAAINYQTNSLSILLGQVDGSFVDTGLIYPVGVQPVAAEVGDFNGDGVLDLAVVNQVCATEPCPPGSVSILLGNGDGTFAAGVAFETAPDPVAVSVRDVNGDGNWDLVVAAAISRIRSDEPGMVSVLLGNGDGTFQPPVDSAAGRGVIGLVTGDYNSDGLLDVVVDNHPTLSNRTVSLLLGRGDGSFQPPTDLIAGADPISLATGDFDSDANLDLAVATGPGRISILLGNGDGTFQPFVDYASGFGPYRLIATDFNQDGTLDLIVSITTNLLSNGAISVLPGAGNGTFLPHTEYLTGTFGQLVSDDFNGDGKPDLAVANRRSTVSVLLGVGDGTLMHATQYPTGQGPAAVVIADFNGDGYLDLAATNSQGGTVSVLLGNPDGTFSPRADFATGTEPSGLTVSDFNLDGKLDLAVANSSDDTVSILLGNGDGTFAPPRNFATGRVPRAVIAADFNVDGKIDLAVTNSRDGTVSILLGNGDATFNPPLDFSAGPGAAGIVAGDFNADGVLDLAVADADTPVTFRDPGLVSVLLGNGDGTFQTHLDSFTASLKPLDLIAADFTGDGKLDLAVVTRLDTFGSVSILTGNGDGTFEMTQSYMSGRFSQAIAQGDFNRDGVPDLAVVNLGSNTMTLWNGHGDGTFQLHGQYETGIGPSGIGTGDFNADGALDAAVVNLGSNTVSVLLSATP